MILFFFSDIIVLFLYWTEDICTLLGEIPRTQRQRVPHLETDACDFQPPKYINILTMIIWGDDMSSLLLFCIFCFYFGLAGFL